MRRIVGLAATGIALFVAGTAIGWALRGDGDADTSRADATSNTDATPPPSTTSTSPPLAVTLVEMTAPNQVGIEFDASAPDPAPRQLGLLVDGVVTTQLALNYTTWSAEDGELTFVAPFTTSSDEVQIDNFDAGAVTAAAGAIWVIDRNGSELVKVDPASHEVTGRWPIGSSRPTDSGGDLTSDTPTSGTPLGGDAANGGASAGGSGQLSKAGAEPATSPRRRGTVAEKSEKPEVRP
jgi:hypothetical protein